MSFQKIIEKIQKLEPSEALNALHDVKNHPDIFNEIKSNIPTIVKNDKVIVDPVYQKNVLNFDPMGAAEDICEIINIEKENVFTFGIFNIAIIAAVKEVVRTMTADFSERGSTWEEYLDGVENLGFEEVLELPKNDDDENNDVIKYFWNYSHSILWVINSFSWSDGVKKVNSSTIYLEGIKRDPTIHHELPISHGIAFNTDISVMSCDMREMPTYKLFELLEKFDTSNKYWVEYNCYDQELMLNMDKLPTDVRDFMTSRIALSMDLKKKHIKKSEMHFAAEKFVSSLSESDKLLGVSWVYRIGYESMEINRLPNKFDDMMSNFSDNIDDNFKAYVSDLFFNIRKHMDIDNLDIFFVENVEDDVLKVVYDKLSKRKYQSMNETAFAILESKFKEDVVLQ